MNQGPSLAPAKAGVRAGLLCRCPHCGAGPLFTGFLKVVDRCAVCGFDFTRLNTGDGAAIFIMQIAGAIVVFGALFVQVAYDPPIWAMLVVSLPLVALLSIGLMRPGKGVMIALQMRNLHSSPARGGGRVGKADPTTGPLLRGGGDQPYAPALPPGPLHHPSGGPPSPNGGGMMRARFPWGLTIVCALAVVLLCGLGVWQLQRMQWKNRLIAQAEAADTLPPAPLVEVLALNDPVFRKVLIDCPGLPTAPYVELQTIHEGQAGVRLISACRPTDVPAEFLIDRGFVAGAVSARPPVAASVAPFRVTAQLRLVPPPGPMALPVDQGRFFARDTPGMARALGVADPDPNTLYALTSSNPEWQALQPSAPPAAFSNNHLGYALTWFGLALALVGFYVALLRRKLTS